MKENKLVQEALIQMKQVEEAIAENAKGILQSTMKEEISQLVKESLTEQDEEDEIEMDADVIDTDADNDEMSMDMDVDTDDIDTDDVEMDDVEMDMDVDMDSDESPIDLTDASDEEILKVFKAMGENDGIIVKKDGGDVHLTDENADVEYLVKLGESEEDFTLTDDEYTEEMDEESDETVDSVIDAIFSEDMSDDDMSYDDMSYDDEVVYEITLDDDSEMKEDVDMTDFEVVDEDEDFDFAGMTNEAYSSKKTKPKGVGIGSGPKFSYKDKAKGGFKEDKKEGPKTMGTGKAKFEYKKGANMEGKSKVVKAETKEGWGSKKDEFKREKVNGVEKKAGTKGGHYKDYEKTETKEAARTYGMGSKEGRGLRKGITPNRNIVYKESIEQEEVRMLREKNEEYRKALNVFREKLNEVAIFNSNLAYATRLFTEHSTTKKEKINILRRFDDVETLKESKNLYKSIKDELTKVETKSINESVATKLNKTVSTGSSTTLIESKTYENPQFLRMKDLMGKLG
jgi:hypothetical protein